MKACSELKKTGMGAPQKNNNPALATSGGWRLTCQASIHKVNIASLKETIERAILTSVEKTSTRPGGLSWLPPYFLCRVGKTGVWRIGRNFNALSVVPGKRTTKP